MVAQLVLLTLVIRRWGLEYAGAFSLALSLTGLTGLFDFGVASAALRALGVDAEARGRSAASILTLALGLNVVLTIGLLTIALIAGSWGTLPTRTRSGSSR